MLATLHTQLRPARTEVELDGFLLLIGREIQLCNGLGVRLNANWPRGEASDATWRVRSKVVPHLTHLALAPAE